MLQRVSDEWPKGRKCSIIFLKGTKWSSPNNIFIICFRGVTTFNHRSMLHETFWSSSSYFDGIEYLVKILRGRLLWGIQYYWCNKLNFPKGYFIIRNLNSCIMFFRSFLSAEYIKSMVNNWNFSRNSAKGLLEKEYLIFLNSSLYFMCSNVLRLIFLVWFILW